MRSSRFTVLASQSQIKNSIRLNLRYTSAYEPPTRACARYIQHPRPPCAVAGSPAARYIQTPLRRLHVTPSPPCTGCTLHSNSFAPAARYTQAPIALAWAARYTFALRVALATSHSAHTPCALRRLHATPKPPCTLRGLQVTSTPTLLALARVTQGLGAARNYIQHPSPSTGILALAARLRATMCSVTMCSVRTRHV
jgi:hypothetical protein